MKGLKGWKHESEMVNKYCAPIWTTWAIDRLFCLILSWSQCDEVVGGRGLEVVTGDIHSVPSLGHLPSPSNFCKSIDQSNSGWIPQNGKIGHHAKSIFPYILFNLTIQLDILTISIQVFQSALQEIRQGLRLLSKWILDMRTFSLLLCSR